MKRIIILIFAYLYFSHLVTGQFIKVMVQPQSMLQIQGKTNVNSFQCYCAPPASVVGFNVESSSETQKINFKKAELTVLTKSLDCRHKIMNRDMYQTLKAEHYPTITLSISQVLIPIHSINARWIMFRFKRLIHIPIATEAYLTLAGMKRKIDLLVTISQPFSNIYRFTAKKSLLLTDFGLTPPTALMGMVKVKNEIILDIDLYLSAYPPPTS
jgi:polyisoprenoid-binding protein YceI